MHHPKKLGLIANLILCFVLQTLGADKYTDENRPYEFGFKIDGQQHRHESKDEDGIIMGEFGFVTADDVYHVTVYATDKEGRFKILSMKNIHLKSTSDLGFGAPTSARQGHSLALPPAPAASVRVSAVPQKPPKQDGVSVQPRLGPFTPQAGPVSQAPQPGKPSKSVSIEPPANSCSSCSLPTTTTRAPPPAYNQVTDNNNYNSPNQIGKPGSSPQNQPAFLSTPGQQNKAQGGPISPSYSPREGQQSYASGQQNVPQRELVAPNGAQSFAPQPGQAAQNYPGSLSYSQGSGVSNLPNNVQGGPSGSSYSASGGQQNYPSSQQNIAQGGFIAPGGAQSFAPQPGQTVQNYPGSPSYSQGPGVSNTPNNVQGGPSGSSYSASGGQQNYPSSQQNIAQGGFIAPGGAQSFAPQPGQTVQRYPGSPNYSQGPSIPSTSNNVQGGLSGSLPRGGQQNYPSSQQNTPQGGFVSPDGVQSFASQPGQIPQNYPGSPSYSQGPGIPNAPNNAQGGPSGSSQNPQGGQQNYLSSQAIIPQGGLVSPGGAQPFAPIPDHTSQNNPGTPSYSQGPGIPKAPNNYAQPGGVGQQVGLLPTNAEEQNRLFSSHNNPYAGTVPSGSASSVPDAGNFRQNIAQQAGPSGPINTQSPGKSPHPQGGAGERTSKQYKGPEQQFNSNLGPVSTQSPGAALGARRATAKPMLYAAQMQIVDKNTDIYALGPNEQKGLPPGLSHGDMAQLLYTFNYTVGFHGHFEEGYANGAKQGYYFVTGRNGVRTRIDYVADDTGFHPKVSQEVLDLLSEDVPKPETEKDEKYGLKGYEFKWLYYPVESR